LTSHNSWVRLFDETIASLNFPFKNKKLNSAEILNLLSDNKSSIRKLAAKSIGVTLGNNANLFATITNTLAKDKSINDDWRKLPNPVSSRNLSNSVEDEVVESLSRSVSNYYPKFGFKRINQKNLILPGAIDPERLHIIFFEEGIENKMGDKPWTVKSSN